MENICSGSLVKYYIINKNKNEKYDQTKTKHGKECLLKAYLFLGLSFNSI